MAEVLSQQEIDLLLNNVKSGQEQSLNNVNDKEAVPFDFRLPNRISKNQLRTIKTIHESFAESFNSYLVSKLQSVTSVNVTAIDQIYYSEYILSVSNPACLFTFEISNLDIKGVLELNTDFAFTLIDRLLGGNGKGVKQNKIITPIEQRVLAEVVEKIMDNLKNGWHIIDELDFRVGRFESDIDFAQITSHNESVLLISFEIMIAEQSYSMNLCFATFAFDSILTKLSSQKFSLIRPSKHQGITPQEIISNHLYKTFLPVTVEFGSAKISMQDMIDMKIGDIIKLDTKISDEHLVKIGNKIFFAGRSGIVNNHKAVKISQKIALPVKSERQDKTIDGQVKKQKQV